MLRGNLCPDGAIIKPSAATPKLLKHRGRAVVFENIEDFHKRIDDPKLDIDENCIMVLKNCGPKGYPGMAEVGNMPLPPKLLKKGITDMVRISDARMSGTAYGTVVLHIAPEAAAGGPLALVRERRHDRARRGQAPAATARVRRRNSRSAARKWKKPKPPLARGYWKLYFDHVLQAHRGRRPGFPRRQERRLRAARQSLADKGVGNEIQAHRSRSWASALAAGMSAAPALAQQKLKFAHVYEASEPYHTAALWAAGEIAKRTGEPLHRGRVPGLVAGQRDADQPGR